MKSKHLEYVEAGETKKTPYNEIANLEGRRKNVEHIIAQHVQGKLKAMKNS